MPKLRHVLLIAIVLLLGGFTAALERQPNSDYRARREALAKKVNGVVVLFSNIEHPADLYLFRQDENFYYLTGWNEPVGALLIASE